MSTITLEQVKAAAEKGQQNAAEALTILAKRTVSLKTESADLTSNEDVQVTLQKMVGKGRVIAFTQTMSGDQGISLLSLEKEHAYNLVDLFNNRPKGTTTTMDEELDRSTITETLNILANAYVAELVKSTGQVIFLTVPQIATPDKLGGLQEDISSGKADGVLLQTDLAVEDAEFSVDLLFIFFLAN